jgi:hypothetical protein
MADRFDTNITDDQRPSAELYTGNCPKFFGKSIE